jgi:hypothetical protein
MKCVAILTLLASMAFAAAEEEVCYITQTDCDTPFGQDFSFDALSQVDVWTYGKLGAGEYMQLDADTPEVTHVFQVDDEVDEDARFYFKLLEVSDFGNAVPLIRVGESYFNIASSFALAVGAEETTSFSSNLGTIAVTATRLSSGSTTYTVYIPKAIIGSDRLLTIGMRLAGAGSAVAGIDDTNLFFDCQCSTTVADCENPFGQDFTLEEQAEVWLNGKLGDGGAYMQLDADTPEVTNTFQVSTAYDAEFSFKLLEVSDFGDAVPLIRVGESYLNIASSFALGIGAEETSSFGTITVTATRLSSDSTAYTVYIPKAMFSGGLLTMGMRLTEAGSAVAGIDDTDFDFAGCQCSTTVANCDTDTFGQDFTSTAQADVWTNGKLGAGDYMQLDTDTPEVTNTFQVSTAYDAEFSFKLLEVSDFGDAVPLIRVGEYYLNIASSFALGIGAEETSSFGTITVTATRLSSDSTAYTVYIPKAMLSGGLLTMGMRLAGAGSAIAGIDDTNLIFDCGKDGGGGGDPHIMRWDRERSSFHGECDLVLVHSDKFHNNAGLDVHVRSTIADYYSYFESSVLRVGEHVMDFQGENFFVNGVKHTAADLPITLGNTYKYTISEVTLAEGMNPLFYNYYKVDLHDNSSILFRFYKHFLTISINGHVTDFSDAVGLMGDYQHGDMVGRNGQIMDDFDEFGFEWQVSPDETMLFHDARAPQLPYERCRMPTAARPSRRKLRGVDRRLLDAAQTACAHVQADRDLCVDDVVATGDLGMATVW